MPKAEVVVDGVLCKWEQCDHCGRVPSPADLRAAVKMSKETWIHRKCGVCGKPQLLQELELYHYKEGDQDRWGSRVTLWSPMLLLEAREGFTYQLFLHPECAMKAIPHVKWGFPVVAQKG